MKLKNNKTYLPRDISWMYFNHRILQEARKENVPLLERISFLGIYSNNLDEFFRVRMASLSRIVEFNDKEAKDEREEALSILKDINKLNAQYAKEFEQAIQEITNKLKEENIYLINDKEANEEQLDFIRSYYRENLNGMVIPVWFSTMGLKKGNYLLLTLNRHDLLEKKAVLHSLVQTVLEKANGMPVVAPLHPYVEKAIKALEFEAPNLHILPPQSYLHFGFLINQAKGIVTDSGNIAEEATFLDVPCITLNTYAEHPETWRIGTNELVGENLFALSASLDKLLHGEWKHATLPDRWDGRTAERIVQTLITGEKL